MNFDDIKAKIEEALGGAGDQAGGVVDDATSQITDHAQDFLGGLESENSDEK